MAAPGSNAPDVIGRAAERVIQDGDFPLSLHIISFDTAYSTVHREHDCLAQLWERRRRKHDDVVLWCGSESSTTGDDVSSAMYRLSQGYSQVTGISTYKISTSSTPVLGVAASETDNID
ncbi:hypothetical protein Bbelb_093390 [Branchiostoma belcheri]|nr:hypothetical protein Bbelb_093390 [Branchiostoma belcheri]